MLSFLLIICLVECLMASQREFFTSMSDMTLLQKLESQLAHEFLDYYEKESRRLADLEKFIDEVSKGHTSYDGLDQSIDRDYYHFHPTNGLKLMTRFVRGWQNTGIYSKTNSASKDSMMVLHSTLTKYAGEFPDNDDLYGAVTALTRLQDAYNISARQFADGTIGSLSESLSIDEMFEVGYLAMGMNDFYHADEWLRDAMSRFETQSKSMVNFFGGSLKKAGLLELLAWTEYQTGKLDEAIKHTEELCALEPESQSARMNLKLYREELNRGIDDRFIERKFGRKKEEWTDRNNQMCRGEEMPISVRSKLFCRYVSPHPMFILKPVRMEEAYPDPLITVYHDVLRDWAIDHIINISRPALRRATVHDPKTGQLKSADYRVSKTAWFNGEMDEVVAHIERKTEALIGLDLRYSEPFQVSNYGIGGQYEPHFDHATTDRKFVFAKAARNRIATCLFYLTTVEAGGSTPFIQTGKGAIAHPVKGDLVFWYNLKRNGKSNPKTRHSACPVLLGSKWVANFWIHESGQEFRRPCSLNPDE